MKKERIKIIFAFLCIMTSIYSIKGSNYDKLISISLFGIFLILIPFFDIAIKRLNINFSHRKKLWLTIGTFLLPGIYVKENTNDITNIDLLCAILTNIIFWIAMFKTSKSKTIDNLSKKVKERNEFLNDNFLEKNEKNEISKSNKKNITQEYFYPIYKIPNINLITDPKLLKSYSKIINSKCNNIEILLGKNNNIDYIESLESMPNLLISGTVMTGKTSFINSIIASILLSKKPDELKMIIVDPKGIDYQQYNDIPHLLTPVINDSKKISFILEEIVEEIKFRYDKLKISRTKNIEAYNKIASDEYKMKKIIIIIDDLNSFDYNIDALQSIEYISSLGWKTGIHIILSCAHPSKQVMSTISKINFPARLSFRVTSSINSKNILNETGAEKLSSIGSALYISSKTEKALKINVPYISDNDINNILGYIKTNKTTFNNKNIKREVIEEEPLYNEIVEFVVEQGKASSSLIQRRFRLGYNRADHIMDLLEERGIVGPATGSSKPRDVLVGINKKNK